MKVLYSNNRENYPPPIVNTFNEKDVNPSALKFRRITRTSSAPVIQRQRSAVIKAGSIEEQQLNLRRTVCQLHATNELTFVQSFYNLPLNITLIEAFLKYTIVVDEFILIQAIMSFNKDLLALVLKYTDEKIIKENAHSLMVAAKNIGFIEAADLLFEKCPTLLEACDPIVLAKEACSEGHGGFLEWLLTKNIFISPKLLEDFLHSACAFSHLGMIKSLCDYNARTYRLANFNYPAILELDKLTDREALLKRITYFCITTPLTEVYALAALMPEKIAEVLPEALELSALCVRFPHLNYAREVDPSFVDPKKYLESSYQYAQENRAFLTATKRDFPTWKREEFLDAIVRNRKTRNHRLHKHYEIKTKDGHKTGFTPFYTQEAVPRGELFYPVPLRTCRYTHTVKHFVEFIRPFQNTEDLSKSYPISSLSSMIQFNYVKNDAEGKECCFPTTVRSVNQWMHTLPHTIRRLQNHLETSHQELLHFPLNPTNREQWNDILIEGYWLISTLCERWRGTPHNAMLWLNAFTNAHHQPPIIPKMDYFFLDNTMVTLPLEYVKEKWASFLEPPIDQGLPSTVDQRATLKKLLQVNGMILRHCSDAVRSDEELTSIAIEQNPAAKFIAIRGIS